MFFVFLNKSKKRQTTLVWISPNLRITTVYSLRVKQHCGWKSTAGKAAVRRWSRRQPETHNQEHTLNFQCSTGKVSSITPTHALHILHKHHPRTPFTRSWGEKRTHKGHKAAEDFGIRQQSSLCQSCKKKSKPTKCNIKTPGLIKWIQF